MDQLKIGAKVLHVEDDPRQGVLVRRMLQRAPDSEFDVTLVTTLAEAIAALSAENFDLCLLDLGLPDSGGVNAVSAIRAANATLPIVVVTGVDDPWAALAAIKQGASDFLVKDALHPRSLLRAVLLATQGRSVETSNVGAAIINAMSDGVVFVDGESTVIFANAAAVELLRYDGQLTGSKLSLPEAGSDGWTRLIDSSGQQRVVWVRSEPAAIGGHSGRILTLVPLSRESIVRHTAISAAM